MAQEPSGVCKGTFANRGTMEDLALPMPSQRAEPPVMDGLSLFHLLELLAFGGRVGRLDLQGTSLRLRLYLTGGELHAFRVLRGPDMEEATVRALVGRGDIDETLAAEVLDYAKRQNKRATFLLFERARISAGQVVMAVRGAQRGLLNRLMRETRGYFVFEEGARADVPRDAVRTDFRTLVASLLDEQLKRRLYPELSPYLADLERRYLGFDAQALARLPGLTLGKKEKHTAETVLDGSRTMLRCFELSTLGRRECARLIYLLRAVGALQLHAHYAGSMDEDERAAALARLAQKKADADHFTALGLRWTCHPDDIARAAELAESRFGPESALRSLPGCAALADAIYERMTSAHAALADQGPRRAYRDALFGELRIRNAALFLAKQAEESHGDDPAKARRLIECAEDLLEHPRIAEIRARLGK